MALPVQSPNVSDLMQIAARESRFNLKMALMGMHVDDLLKILQDKRIQYNRDLTDSVINQPVPAGLPGMQLPEPEIVDPSPSIDTYDYYKVLSDTGTADIRTNLKHPLMRQYDLTSRKTPFRTRSLDYPIHKIIDAIFENSEFKNNGALEVLSALLDNPYVDFTVLNQRKQIHRTTELKLTDFLKSEEWQDDTLENPEAWSAIADALIKRGVRV